ncbi:transposase [Wolbachia endosymbiont (group A) of Barypeithes pellucidus]|uniref:transposase n=1 Tax=Wolbachia endosymbiont (group A) of Barypeithes pellucidus TaxID=3139322 RepID=UPI003CCAFF64
MVGKGSKFESLSLRVEKAIKDLDKVSKTSIEALVCSLEAIEKSLRKLDKILSEQGEKDEDCKLLTTTPGVGIIVAMTFKAAIDNPHRFEKSDTVGAYIGLTPRQYSSGEVDRHGSISKMGPMECRAVVLKVNRKIDVAVNKYLKFVWTYLFTATLVLDKSRIRTIFLSEHSTISY